MTAPKFNKEARDRVVVELKKRDGNRCMFPGCTKPFTAKNPPTIDHWLPWSIFRDASFDNLKLMHQKCNNIKGNIVPNADGTISFKDKRRPKAPRPELCNECMSGRILLDGEICPFCGSGPMPKQWPSSYKKKAQNCSHAGRDHCFSCFLGFVPREDEVSLVQIKESGGLN